MKGVKLGVKKAKRTYAIAFNTHSVVRLVSLVDVTIIRVIDHHYQAPT